MSSNQYQYDIMTDDRHEFIKSTTNVPSNGGNWVLVALVWRSMEWCCRRCGRLGMCRGKSCAFIATWRWHDVTVKMYGKIVRVNCWGEWWRDRLEPPVRQPQSLPRLWWFDDPIVIKVGCCVIATVCGYMCSFMQRTIPLQRTHWKEKTSCDVVYVSIILPRAILLVPMNSMRYWFHPM